MTYSANYIVKPNLVVDGYFGYTRNDTVHNPVRQDETIGKTLGLPGTNLTPEAGGWPDFQISTYSDVGTPGGSSALRYNDRSWEYTANASWIHSAHNIRFGVDVSKYQINHYEATSAMGVFVFNGGVTTLRGGPSPNQYNSYAQFLLGLTSSVSSEIHPFDDNRMTSRQNSYSFFVQDQWQVSKKLTASMGVRWDYFPMGTRKSRGMERYNFDTNQMSICGVGNVPTDCGYHIEQKNFSPRVGLAYRPDDATVIRTGFGMNYDPYPLSFVRNMLTNYPNDLLLTINQTSTQTAATELKAGIPAISRAGHQFGRGQRAGRLCGAVAAAEHGARLHHVVEFQRAKATAGLVHRAGRIRGLAAVEDRAAARPERRPGAGRGRQRAAFLHEVRTHHRHRTADAGRAQPLRWAANVTAAPHGSRRDRQRLVHLLKGHRDLLRRSERRISADPDPAVHAAQPRAHEL